MIRLGRHDAATSAAFWHNCRRHEAYVDAALEPYLLRETIDRVVPSNGPNPAATADG